MRTIMLASATLALTLMAAGSALAAPVTFFMRGTFSEVAAAQAALIVGATAGQTFDARLTVETAISDADLSSTAGRYVNAVTNFEFLSATLFLARTATPGDVSVRNNAGSPEDRLRFALGLSGPEPERGLELTFIDDQGTMLGSDALPSFFNLTASGADVARLRIFAGDGVNVANVFASLSYFARTEPPPLPPPTPQPPQPPPSQVPEPTALALMAGALGASAVLRRRSAARPH